MQRGDWVGKGEGAGGGAVWEAGVGRGCFYIHNGSPTRSDCIVQGAIFNILWESKWKRIVKKNAYVCITITLLSSSH